MAITVCGTCIDFGSQSICVDPAGIYVSGKFAFKSCDINPHQGQGTQCGFAAGGIGPAPRISTIQKWSFSSDGNATNFGNLGVMARACVAGASSSTHGYILGGYGTPPPGAEIVDCRDFIQKFPFSSGGTATDVAELLGVKCSSSGHESATHGYNTGGQPEQNEISKFQFSTDGNATDVGNLTRNYKNHASITSAENGYSAGGNNDPSANNYDKFPFTSDTNATDVGELGPVGAREKVTGNNSKEAGYMSGGNGPGGRCREIHKFPFASEGNMSNVGNALCCFCAGYGASSDASGYLAGGAGMGGVNRQDVIQKFSFASDADSTDVGELTACVHSGAGFQV